MHEVKNKELKTNQNKIKKGTKLIESHVPTKYKIERAHPLSRTLTF